MSENFLSRWSRRKREAQRSEAPGAPVEPPADGVTTPDGVPEPAATATPEPVALATPEPAAGPQVEISEAEIAKLPSLDTLTADSDISGFLRKGVPEGLRNAALRRMWSLDPKIRDFVSEAREYAYDWNTPGGVPGFGGPLPPLEEVQRLAARIVGAADPAAAQPVEPADSNAPDKDPSQSGESSTQLSPPSSHVVPPQPLARVVTGELPQSANPLENLGSRSPPGAAVGMDQAPDDRAARQSTPERPSKPLRPSRHGGAMPV